jgi:hypothetical protein
MKNAFLFGSILVMAFYGCYTKNVIIYSLDKTQKIKVFSDVSEIKISVYDFSDRKHFNEIGHVVFDTRKVDYLSQALFVCWKNDGYNMSILCPKSTIDKNNLDSALYKISTAHVVDEKGLPLIKKYHSKGCFELAIIEGNVNFMGDGIVEE